MVFECTQKENVDNLLRLRFGGIAKRLYCLNEQMSTPSGVNDLLQFLQYFLKFGEFPKQESKVDVLCLMSFYCYLSP